MGPGRRAKPELLLLGRMDAIGRAVAERFARDGFASFHLAPEGMPVHGDGATVPFADPGAWRERLAQREPAVVILAPPWSDVRAFVDTPPDAWLAAIEANLEGVTYALQATGERMIARGAGGHVVALLHVAALSPYRGLSAFGTTLAGVRALLGMLALELAPHGVAVNSVAPGFVRDGPLDLQPAALEVLAADTPRGDVVGPEEVAEVVRAIAALPGTARTGTVVPVHGGFGLTRGRVGPAPFVGGGDRG